MNKTINPDYITCLRYLGIIHTRHFLPMDDNLCLVVAKKLYADERENGVLRLYVHEYMIDEQMYADDLLFAPVADKLKILARAIKWVENE